jgi:hypothetical protein
VVKAGQSKIVVCSTTSWEAADSDVGRSAELLVIEEKQLVCQWLMNRCNFRKPFSTQSLRVRRPEQGEKVLSREVIFSLPYDAEQPLDGTEILTCPVATSSGKPSALSPEPSREAAIQLTQYDGLCRSQPVYVVWVVDFV